MSRSESVIPPARADLADVEPYVSPQMPARYRMNTNESPYPPPADLIDQVTEGLARTQFNRYPDRDAPALVAALSEYVGWDHNGIWVANGSNEVLLHVFLTFGGPERTSVTFEPTYSLHTLIPKIAGTQTRRGGRVNGSWSIAADELERSLDGADIALFCSPNNPTGGLEDRRTIERAAELVPLVVVDEAYIEFARKGSSFLDMLGDHPNVVITRTFSKAWSLAGARLGYLLADEGIVNEMAKVRLPYSLSAFSQLIGAAALDHDSDARERIKAIRTERTRIAEGIESVGCRVHGSDANFVLFDVGTDSDTSKTESVWRALLSKGVLVRNYPQDPVLAGCLRVTAGTAMETDAFLNALEEVL